MWIFTPRYLKEAKHYLAGAKKLHAYRSDIFSEKENRHLLDNIDRLKSGMKNRNRDEVQQAMQDLDHCVEKIAPPKKHAAWRENCEVIIVAIIIAAGIRAYFLQPFKIPTGSMQPTLYGIVGYPSDAPAPNIFKRAIDLVIFGRNFIDLKSKADGDTVIAMREKPYLNFFTFTDIQTQKTSYRLFAPLAPLQNDFGLTPGRRFNKGDTMARGYIQTGDQVFVDKLSYHFTRPKPADVFVFKTIGIRRIQSTLPVGVESQHYIKRLAGIPGQTLRIAPPDLYVNGKIAPEAAFQRVMSEKDGYRGYSNGLAVGYSFQFLGSPTATFKIPEKAYFALGDNSYNSSDSRNWGIVPEENVAGKGAVVYWPFSKRWGWIR
ncbi:MAG: signal peptidase I [Chthoniobacterales bacterium]